MKKLPLIIIAFSLFSSATYALDDASSQTSNQQAHKHIAGKGTVVSVKPNASKITLKHEAIPSIDWPAMTMAFDVKNKAQLTKLKKGDQVKFTLTPKGDEYLIDDIKKK